MILLTDLISQSSNFCVIVLDETTYYITAFAVDSNNVVISSQQTTITTDFGWHPSANTYLYYKLESDINDYSGNSRNGTIRAGSLSYTTSGGTKQVAFFNRNTVFSIPNIAGTYSTYTFNVWCKPTGTDTWQELFDNVWSSNTNNVYLNFNGSTSTQEQGSSGRKNFAYQYRPGGGSSSYSVPRGTADLSINTWYNICVIGNSSGVKLYLNGTKIGEVSTTGTIILNNYSSGVGGAGIGGRLSTLQNFFRGYMSEFIFENGNWSESDLSAYVNKTKSRYGL